MIIVVGVDASAPSEAARRAVALSKREDAELHVVHVLHVPASLLTALASVPAPVLEYGAAERSAVWSLIEPLLAEMGDGAIRVDLEGYPPDMLVDYAESVGADLIVVGSRGRGELAALFMGSTSHRVLHLAKCDVLVARSEED